MRKLYKSPSGKVFPNGTLWGFNVEGFRPRGGREERGRREALNHEETSLVHLESSLVTCLFTPGPGGFGELP